MTNQLAKNGQCHWWLAGNTQQCCKPTQMHYDKIEDGSRRRGYATFCPEHAARAAEQALAREDSDEE